MSKTGHMANLNLHEHFSTVARVYRELRTTDEAPIRFIRDKLAGLASIRAADVGCGAGRYGLLLFRHLPNLHLTCVDVNPEMLEQLSAYLAANGTRDFETVASGVEELEFEDGSLDCVFTFNAVHHFDFRAFIGKARDATRQSGGIFIYTRTPSQNAGTIWGRYFPGFLDKETRLYHLADMKEVGGGNRRSPARHGQTLPLFAGRLPRPSSRPGPEQALLDFLPVFAPGVRNRPRGFRGQHPAGLRRSRKGRVARPERHVEGPADGGLRPRRAGGVAALARLSYITVMRSPGLIAPPSTTRAQMPPRFHSALVMRGSVIEAM